MGVLFCTAFAIGDCHPGSDQYGIKPKNISH